MEHESIAKSNSPIIAIIGLGYVGLPLSIALSEHYSVIGFDINSTRIESLHRHIDLNREIPTSILQSSKIQFTNNKEDLKKANIYIIAVPTDIDADDSPDLSYLIKASEMVGGLISHGDIVIYESTVYPGCTEEVCLPILEELSGLKSPIEFSISYSPERIVPGELMESLKSSIKIIGSQNDATSLSVKSIYDSFLYHEAQIVSSIMVAEAAKVVENTQRDINISLINELSVIFDKIGISTHEVIEAASTKWNFHPYSPGLVGGHCISVDPFYLIHKAKKVGHLPQVIAAGRRVNEYIPKHIATKVTQELIKQGKNPGNTKVLVMGLAFKENVSDIRNSKVIDLMNYLNDYSICIDTLDPHVASYQNSRNHYAQISDIRAEYDAIILCVAHDEFKDLSEQWFEKVSIGATTLFDVKGIYRKQLTDESIKYWTL